MWPTALWDNGLPWLQWGVVLAASLAAMCTDLAWRRIHNMLTAPMLVAGVLFAFMHAGAAGAFDSVLACVLLALPYVLLFMFANGGAGDAKLMGAIGAWMGVVNGAIILCFVGIAGIVMAISYAAYHRRAREVTLNVAGMATNVIVTAASRGKVAGILAPAQGAPLRMPYGVAIFVGVCLAGLGVLLW